MMRKRLHAYFSGRVQGVGFRFTVREIADELQVLGWVRNLPAGQVELVAEAEEDTLKEFLTKIKRYFSIYIHDTDVQWQDADDEFSDFGIRFR